MTLLAAVRDGRVLRGSGDETTVFAPHFLDGEPVRLQLHWLAGHNLIHMPISGPPSLAPRGARLLRLAAGAVGENDNLNLRGSADGQLSSRAPAEAGGDRPSKAASRQRIQPRPP